MSAKHIHTWLPFTKDDWILKVIQLSDDSIIASASNGSLVAYSLSDLASSLPKVVIEKAHEASINDIVKINETTVASCSSDGIKIWDLKNKKAIATLTNDKNSNFLSLAYKNNLLVGGTELVGIDAELHIWDVTSTDEVVRSFIDSHHDDITALEFHPTLNNYLMSGSTDGCVNIYDLNQSDEDEALHQVINYASVHSNHFITDSRISILTHMESLMFYDLNDTNYEELVEPKFNDLGDTRELWPDNEYVIDVRPQGYAAYGANSKGTLSLLSFNPEKESFDKSTIVDFPGAHGEEVVRDLLVVPNSKTVVTCGEDGSIKVWELPYKVNTVVVSEDSKEVAQDVAMHDADSEKSKKKKDKKDKKDKKKDKKKKDKKKSKKDVRYKPY